MDWEFHVVAQLVPLARPPQLLDPWLAPDVLSSAEAVTIVPNSRPTSTSWMCSSVVWLVCLGIDVRYCTVLRIFKRIIVLIAFVLSHWLCSPVTYHHLVVVYLLVNSVPLLFRFQIVFQIAVFTPHLRIGTKWGEHIGAHQSPNRL